MTRYYKYKHGNEHQLPPPPPPQEGYVYTPPPPLPQEGYVYTPPPPMTKSQTKKKHIMKISHINVNIYDKTVTSQQK